MPHRPQKSNGIAKGLEYQTGYDRNFSTNLPIMLALKHVSFVQGPFETWWTIESAEAMAFSLMKSVELARRELAKRAALDAACPPAPIISPELPHAPAQLPPALPPAGTA